jgi:ssDNA-binding Zn-finger/Zn-ribbon topoisomerase 1
VSGNIKNWVHFNGYKITTFQDKHFEKGEINENELYRSLVNDLLGFYEIEDVETFKQNRIDLTLEIGSLVKEYIPNDEIIKYFNSLLDNLEQYKPFEVSGFKDKNIQSIALFIQKGESPESLMELLEANKIYDFRVALGLWGSIFGFSALPKTLSDKLFLTNKSASGKIQAFVSNFYNDVHRKLHDLDVKEEIVLSGPIVFQKPNPQNNYQSSSVNRASLGDLNGRRNVGRYSDTAAIPVEKEVKNSSPKEGDVSYSSSTPPTCSICGSRMLIKINSKTQLPFWGCEKYKINNCKGNQKLEENDSQFREPVDKLTGSKNRGAVDGLTSQKRDEVVKKLIIDYVGRERKCKVSDMNRELKVKEGYHLRQVDEARVFIQNNINELEIVKERNSIHVLFSEGFKLRE